MIRLIAAGFPTHFVSQRSTSAIAVCADRHPSSSSGVRHLPYTAVPHHHRCPSSSPYPSSTPFIITIQVHHHRSSSACPSKSVIITVRVLRLVQVPHRHSRSSTVEERRSFRSPTLDRTPAAILVSSRHEESAIFSCCYHRSRAAVGEILKLTFS